MGEKSTFQVALLIGLFAATSLVIHLHASIPPSEVQLDKQRFEVLGQWELQADAPFSQSIVKTLELDDYVNMRFLKNGHVVTLYIGYYNSLEKAGAVHSPLVCIPGQGWEVTRTENVVFPIGDNYINAKLIEAELHERRNMIVYWYQAHNRSFPGTLKQKMYAFYAKTFHGNEKNAFVRVSLTTTPGAAENNLGLIEDFLSHFYPRFVEFMAS